MNKIMAIGFLIFVYVLNLRYKAELKEVRESAELSCKTDQALDFAMFYFCQNLGTVPSNKYVGILH